MRVLELELENFARVYTGLGKTHLFLDLRRLKNRIKLFVGDNGTGKTSIMGCIHPYAFNNYTSDNRDNSALIMPDKNGKKRILIRNENVIYEILHIYKRDSKGSISVKSFISKNMEELNVNGNVGSFKAIVEQELGITEQYLILLSLGNSIDGFIDMSTSDRKNFIINLFEELGVYSELYKKKSNDVRTLKSILKNVTFKLDKFRDMNLSDLEDSVVQIDRTIDKLEQEKKFALLELGKANLNLSNYNDFMVEHSSKQQRLQSLLTNLDVENRRLSRNDITEPELLKMRIEQSRTQLSEYQIKHQALTNNIQSKLDIIDGINNTLEQDRLNLSKLETNESTKELLELIANLEVELNKLNDLNPEIADKFNRAEMITVNVYLDELRSMMTDLIIFDNDDLVRQLAHNVLTTPGMDSKVNKAIEKVRDNLSNHTLFTNSNIRLKDVKPIKDRDFNCNSDHLPTCPYVRFYETYMEMVNSNLFQNKQKEDAMSKELYDLEKARDIIFHVNKLIKYVNSNIAKFNLPTEIFDPAVFIDQYLDDRTIYNESMLIQLIDNLELLERKDSIIEKLEIYREKYSNIMSNRDIFNNITDSVLNNTEKLNMHKEEMMTYRTQLDEVSVDINRVSTELQNLESNLDTLLRISEIKKSIKEVTDEIRAGMDMKNKIDQLEAEIRDISEREHLLDTKIREARNTKGQMQATITEIRSLNQEYEDIQYKYDIMMEIRDSLSPTKGIPLQFIQDYICDMASDVNELLHVVYRGRLKLIPQDIIVDDKEFSIPYMRNGTIIPDISNASDGERAIIALAFSLVLSKMSISGYNIMLMDELDTALDDESRGRFIQILETYSDIIGAEDVYIISHNNMFDTYPVSVIMTSDKNIFNIAEEDKLRIY